MTHDFSVSDIFGAGLLDIGLHFASKVLCSRNRADGSTDDAKPTLKPYSAPSIPSHPARRLQGRWG
jgi:hypothetical protein